MAKSWLPSLVGWMAVGLLLVPFVLFVCMYFTTLMLFLFEFLFFWVDSGSQQMFPFAFMFSLRFGLLVSDGIIPDVPRT